MTCRKMIVAEVTERILMVLVIAGVAGHAYGQRANGTGEAIPSSGAPKYVDNEIIVKFIAETITLPEGRFEAALGEAAIDTEAKVLLETSGATSIKRIFRSFTQADTLQSLRTGETVRVQDLSQHFVVSFPWPIDVFETAARFEESARVSYAEPNYLYHLASEPEDPRYSEQWALEQTSDEDIDAEDAWDAETGSDDIILAVLDTGIDYDHEDLGNGYGAGMKVAGGYDYINEDSDPMDDNLHGNSRGRNCRRTDQQHGLFHSRRDCGRGRRVGI